MMKVLRDSHIGSNIRKIRQSKGYTQEHVVAGLQLLGSPIHRVSYAQIESGRNNIFVTDLVAMKQFFDVDYSEFFKGISTSRL